MSYHEKDIVISARDIHKSFGDQPILKGVSLDVHRGGSGGADWLFRLWQNHLHSLHQLP
ncbi:hypothetical protein OS11_33210 [Dickeya oryzae]